MESFKVQSSKILPNISFDPDSGVFTIMGRLISITGEEYITMQSLLSWVDEYSLNPATKTTVTIDLEFCSSAGIKIIHQLFKLLENLYQAGHDTLINWYYYGDDEDSEEKGLQFQKLLDLPFNVIEHP